MRVQGLLCPFIGHHWVQPPQTHEAYPVFECTRCGRRREGAPGSAGGFGNRVQDATDRTGYGPRR